MLVSHLPAVRTSRGPVCARGMLCPETAVMGGRHGARGMRVGGRRGWRCPWRRGRQRWRFKGQNGHRPRFYCQMHARLPFQDKTSDLSVTPLDSTRPSRAEQGVLTGTAPSPWTWALVASWTWSPQWGPKAGHWWADWLQLGILQFGNEETRAFGHPTCKFYTAWFAIVFL